MFCFLAIGSQRNFARGEDLQDGVSSDCSTTAAKAGISSASSLWSDSGVWLWPFDTGDGKRKWKVNALQLGDVFMDFRPANFPGQSLQISEADRGIRGRDAYHMNFLHLRRTPLRDYSSWYKYYVLIHLKCYTTGFTLACNSGPLDFNVFPMYSHLHLVFNKQGLVEYKLCLPCSYNFAHGATVGIE